MERITLKNERFQIIGYVEVAPNGDKTLKNERFQILGYYKKGQNVTKDAHFRIVAYGDVLTSLLR